MSAPPTAQPAPEGPPPRAGRARRWLLGGLLALGIAESAGQLWASRRAPSFEAYAQLVEPVRRLKGPTDVVIVAPRWAEPLARRALGSDVFPLQELARSDVARFEGALEIDAEFKVRVQDLTATRLLLTGAEDGTTITADVPYGGFDLTFTDSPSSLQLAATRVAWKAGEPDADPKGGPAELTLTGRCYGSTPGSVLTATVVNATASY